MAMGRSMSAVLTRHTSFRCGSLVLMIILVVNEVSTDEKIIIFELICFGEENLVVVKH